MLAGLPAISVPCGFDHTASSQPLPVSIQIMGKAFDEASLIETAHVFEQTLEIDLAPTGLQ